MTALARTAAHTTWMAAPSNMAELYKFCEVLAASDLVPKEFKNKPGNCLIAIQWGAEIGLGPLQSVQSIAPINGRPTMWGDGLLALVQAHPDFVDFEEWEAKDPSLPEEGMISYAKLTLKNRKPTERKFSEADVKRAQLGGVHKSYPSRMRQMRARGFAIRDGAAYILRGVASAEEQSDIVATAEVVPEPKPPTNNRAELERVGKQALDSMRRGEPINSPPPPAAAEGPRFPTSWKHDDGYWAGRLMSDAGADTLTVFLGDCSEVDRSTLKPQSLKALETSQAAAEDAMERIISKEASDLGNGDVDPSTGEVYDAATKSDPDDHHGDGSSDAAAVAKARQATQTNASAEARP